MAPRSALAVGFEGGVRGGAVREREAEEGAGSSAIAGGTEGGWPQALAPRSSAAVVRGVAAAGVEGPRAGASSTREGAGMRRHACVYMISWISTPYRRSNNGPSMVTDYA